MEILANLVLCFLFLLGNCEAYFKGGSEIFGKHDKSEAKNHAISLEFSGFYKKLLDNCNQIQDASRVLCKAGNSSCCALFSAADFCVGNCEDTGINTQANVLELFEAITLPSCLELVASDGNCQTPSQECTIIKLFLEICATKFPLLVSPITSPATSPITSPTTSPATSPTTSPVTSPFTSPATSPTTSRPTGVFYCDVLGSGRVQMPVSVWCDDTADCNAHREDEQTANCDGCTMGQFKCSAAETVCQPSTNLCNGVLNCGNNFDESAAICAP